VACGLGIFIFFEGQKKNSSFYSGWQKSTLFLQAVSLCGLLCGSLQNVRDFVAWVCILGFCFGVNKFSVKCMHYYFSKSCSFFYGKNRQRTLWYVKEGEGSGSKKSNLVSGCAKKN